MSAGRGRERVVEQDLGEFAGAEGNEGAFIAVLCVGLHLHALAKIHERFIDLASFRESSACSFGVASTFGTWVTMISKFDATQANSVHATYRPSRQ